VNFKGNYVRARSKFNVTIVYDAVRVPLTSDREYILSLASKRWHEVIIERASSEASIRPCPDSACELCVSDNAVSIRTDLLGLPNRTADLRNSPDEVKFD